MIPHEFRPVVYVAGPFRLPEPFVNIRQAIVAGERLEESGVITAWVPHQNAMWDLVHPHDSEFWLDYDICQLSRSDALYRMPGMSPGADDEVTWAEAHELPVFYDQSDVIAWAESFIAWHAHNG